METQNIEYKESWRDEYLKWVCGFSNAQGGKIFIGINDNGDIVGLTGIKHLLEDIPNKIATTLGIVADVNLRSKNSKEYLEINVLPSNVPISYRGIYHYRSGATKQELNGVALQHFLLKKMGLSWDDITNENVIIDDIDREAVDYFLHKAIDADRMPKSSLLDSTEKVLDNMNLLDSSGHLKNAAILLFGKNPAKFFPLCDFRLGRFGVSASDLMFQDVIEGDLIRMADRVMAVLKSKYLISPIHYDGLQRIETLEIPEDVLREAIFNAIIHKDYAGVHIQMRVYNEKIVLWNQGDLPDKWTIEKLLSEHSSQPRNRNIALAFYKAGFIENWGRGIEKIRQGVIGSGLKEPLFESDEGGLRITIFRKDAFVSSEGTTFNVEKQQSSDNVSAGTYTELTRNLHGTYTELSVQALNVFDLIVREPWSITSKIAGQLGVSERMVRKYTKQLKTMGIIIRAGSDKSGHWEIAMDKIAPLCKKTRV
jgi:ATP-dependent DNA helicase RecG